MNEQQAVLDFFAKTENLPLGLAVAELVDQQRVRLNQQFWQDVQARLQTRCNAEHLVWNIRPTEDKNSEHNWVGLHAAPQIATAQSLSPLLEQQHLGEQLRIYLGVVWQTPPTPEQLTLPAVVELTTLLAGQGFKQNERFLGWQWTLWHPRRRDFLLRYSQQPDSLLNEVIQLVFPLFSPTLTAANAALATLPVSSLIRFSKSP